MCNDLIAVHSVGSYYISSLTINIWLPADNKMDGPEELIVLNFDFIFFSGLLGA